MRASSRDRISIDLRGMKATLLARAQATGVTPSHVIQQAVAAALAQPLLVRPMQVQHAADGTDRVRLSLRVTNVGAQALHERASAAGMPLGDFIVGFMAQAPVLLHGSRPADHLAALVTSSAELSTLSRDIRHLTVLLRQGSVQAAQEYRVRLDGVAQDVKAHLSQAAALMADLRPLQRRRTPTDEPATEGETHG